MRNIFRREIGLDRTICSRCARKVSRRERKPTYFPSYYVGNEWPTRQTEKVYPPASRRKGQNRVFARFEEFDSEDWGYQRDIFKPSIKCQCGLILEDRWQPKHEDYPWNHTKDELLEYGERVAKRLDEKGYEVSKSDLLESLKRGLEEGIDEYQNLKESVSQNARKRKRRDRD